VAVREALTRQSGARRIIVGVDGLAASAGAVHCGFDTAARRGLDVIAVHVRSDLPLSRHSERASRSRTSSYGETGRRCSRSSWVEVRRRHPEVGVREVVTLDRTARGFWITHAPPGIASGLTVMCRGPETAASLAYFAQRVMVTGPVS
jgi:hypothetical protein